MNRSYSKIRHIQESNLMLEERLLSEQVKATLTPSNLSSNLQATTNMTSYFIFNPSTPSYSLDSILGACKKLVKNWNDSCGRNNLQNIVIDIGDDEYVTQFNTFLTQYEQSGEPLICKNDKGKYYIADPGVSCP